MHPLKFAPALLALSIAGPLSAQAPTQVIQLANFRYTPASIHLSAGRPVTLTFANTANGGHDFTAKEFFAASRITAGAAPNGKIELKAHETKSITLVPAAGTYPAHCSHFLHASFGMTGQIVVN